MLYMLYSTLGVAASGLFNASYVLGSLFIRAAKLNKRKVSCVTRGCSQYGCDMNWN